MHRDNILIRKLRGDITVLRAPLCTAACSQPAAVLPSAPASCNTHTHTHPSLSHSLSLSATHTPLSLSLSLSRTLTHNLPLSFPSSLAEPFHHRAVADPPRHRIEKKTGKKRKMTETETGSHRGGGGGGAQQQEQQERQRRSGDAMAEKPTTIEDVFDDTYREKEGPKPPRKLVWRNITVMTLLHIGALCGLFFLPSASFLTLLWTVVCYLFSALGVTAGAHRLWSHRTYKASFPLRVFLALANSMAFQNDIYEWARDHRVHHKYSETDADPHNATRGFFFSHIGWLLVRKHPDVIEKGRKLELSDLKADKVVMFQRRHYKLSVVILCFLVPMLVPCLCWGESLAVGYFIPGLLRYAVVLNATWLVNSAAHMWGNRPYDKNINPRENPLVAFSAIGEGFHNYHHTFPFDYATSEFGCKLNFTTAFIDAMCFLGLAKDRKSVSKEMINARRQRTGESSCKSG